MHDATVQESRS